MTHPRRLPWHTATVDSGGESIYYEVTGPDDGPTIVLAHGAGGSHAVWFQQVPVFADAGWRVVTWDSRGFGNSTFRTGTHGGGASAADLGAVLDDAGVDSAVIAGQSMGGWWATAFALASPTRVDALVLSNTVGGLWTDALFEHFRSFFAGGAVDDRAWLGVHNALAADFVERDPARAFLYQQLNTFHTPPMAEIGAALASTRIEPGQLDATAIPSLVITGSDDTLFPAGLVRDSMSRLQHADIVEIEGAGHSPYFERPDAYNAAVLRHGARITG